MFSWEVTMPLLSVKISAALQKSLARKAKEMGGLSLSDAVRVLLQDALEQPDDSQDKKLQQQLLHYSLTTYYMLQAHLVNSFDEWEKLNDEAHGQANKVLERLLKQ